MKIREDYGSEWAEEGDIAFVENRLELARKAYIEASKYIQGNPHILYKIGRTMKAMNDDSEADYYFKRALKINPDLTEEIFIQKDNELKETLKQKELNKTPLKDENISTESKSENKKKANDKSTEKKHEEKIIDERTLLEEGDRLAENGNYAEALVKYRIYQNEDPTNPSIIARITAMSSRLGDDKSAEDSMNILISKMIPQEEKFFEKFVITKKRTNISKNSNLEYTQDPIKNETDSKQDKKKLVVKITIL